jgi:hypothetical protein
MTENETSAMPGWVRKLLIPALIGGVIGYAASSAVLPFIDRDAVDGLGVSALIAAVVGVFYAAIGLIMVVGTASLRLGARFLNVEDVDDLREQKKVLTLSGAAMLLWGVALLALALAAPDGPVPQAAALAVGGGGLVIGIALSVLVYRSSDELMLAVNLEAAALSYGLLLLVVGLWAMLAHLGYTAAPQPLDLLTLFYTVVLLASFIAVGRRGMLAIK